MRELAPLTALRGQIAFLGAYDAQESRSNTFAAWLDTPFANYPRSLCVYLLISSVCLLAMSLAEGKSRFLAEVQRVRDTLDAALLHPVLYLINEIFSRTNSRDRQLAAAAVIATLTTRRAIGAISTHDITLASIASHGGRNVHMASSGLHPLDFDYRIKAGVTPETNAITIARMAGVPV